MPGLRAEAEPAADTRLDGDCAFPALLDEAAALVLLLAPRVHAAQHRLRVLYRNVRALRGGSLAGCQLGCGTPRCRALSGDAARITHGGTRARAQAECIVSAHFKGVNS